MRRTNHINTKAAKNGLFAGGSALAALGLMTGNAQAQMTSVGKNFTVDPVSGAAVILINGQQIQVPEGQFMIHDNGELYIDGSWLPTGSGSMMQAPPLEAAEQPSMFDGLLGMVGFGAKAKGAEEATVNAPVYAGDPNEADGIFGISQGTLLTGAAVVGGGALLYYGNEEGWFDFDDDDSSAPTTTPTTPTTTPTLQGTYGFVLGSSDDGLTGTAGDDTFGGLIGDFGSSDTIDGGTGNDTFTIEYNNTSSTVSQKSMSNISNVETFVMKDLGSLAVPSSGLNMYALKNISIGTNIVLDGVSSLSGLTLNDIDQVAFSIYAAATGSNGLLSYQNDLHVTKTNSGIKKVIDLDQASGSTLNYTNAKFALADASSGQTLEFDSAARGDIEIIGYSDSSMDLDVSDFGLSATDFATITTAPATAMTNRLEFDTVAKNLYIDQNGDGNFNAADDMLVSFVNAAADLSASDFTF